MDIRIDSARGRPHRLAKADAGATPAIGARGASAVPPRSSLSNLSSLSSLSSLFSFMLAGAPNSGEERVLLVSATRSNARCGLAEAGCRPADAGCQPANAGCRPADAGCRPADAFHAPP
ncbi:uncharacterized protein SCHCODRAFT_02503093 [Schizophyllum commune H4-8]|uniref:Expressed protein n=1 Tax=Schizophyllum commune (strain H4-8 / FGSC 9210) TaxID=578458 RepID=D8Q5W2_SCHCM|nr:uncharacterized protein SCHCODRAFT_02503093 [Schizophyllum commune H4-8]KAI5892002.1 hypothetical protein SCHCODRAFT_02503093 [Schizophyllum commune H4-8]